MVYKQLSLTERHYIELQYKLGASMNKISKELNRSQSTISREIYNTPENLDTKWDEWFHKLAKMKKTS